MGLGSEGEGHKIDCHVGCGLEAVVLVEVEMLVGRRQDRAQTLALEPTVKLLTASPSLVTDLHPNYLLNMKS